MLSGQGAVAGERRMALSTSSLLGAGLRGKAGLRVTSWSVRPPAAVRRLSSSGDAILRLCLIFRGHLARGEREGPNKMDLPVASFAMRRQRPLRRQSLSCSLVALAGSCASSLCC